MIGSHFGVCHLDEGVLNWAIEKWDLDSFLDIGCGTGGMVDLAEKKGLTSWGIDGDLTQQKKGVIVHDFTQNLFDVFSNFDLGWSVEFVEHIEERYLFHVMPAFRLCRRVIMTHALPPNAPPGHVNCQNEKYWVRVFNQWGFFHDGISSDEVREVSTMEREFMRQTGKVFVRR
jgi:SAM-dependent methyltransferase